MATFAELGIPFPLFEAPVEQASGYVGKSNCSLCGSQGTPCFKLGIGDDLMLPCPACRVINGLDADDAKDAPCRSCSAIVPFPNLGDKEKIHVCYLCLRSGRAAMTKDTELGMVSWEQAVSGVTHGRPGLRSSEFEIVPTDSRGEWLGARVPVHHLNELLRTPSYPTWQGEQWLFCCKQPMIYVGDWQSVMNSSFKPVDEHAFFNAVIECDNPPRDDVWKAVARGSESVGIYLFRCASCDRFRAHWDCD